jgi:subtilisin family serine protease
MSTEDQNKAVITLHKGVDVDAFIEDMVSGTNHTEFMPNRRVELFNEKNDSKRNVDFVLTREEAELLKQDPRIIDVRYGTKIENNIFLGASVLETSKVYARSPTLDNTHYNWGIPSCISSTDPFSTTSINFQHGYTSAGSGVDMVISDAGILTDHPEWLTLDGTASRFQQVNWPTVSGLTGTYTQNPAHYTDPTGHGTHVAGTAAGRLYGWAKDANIYAITVVDNAAAFGVSASFNMIRAWHNLKSTTSTGYKRPTVVNMSWEYYATYSNITGGNYRGTSWSGVNMVSAYGMIQTIYNRSGTPGNYTYRHPIRVASVEADMADCIDDGIILIGAAGNLAHKIDVSTGTDYNNYYTSSVDGTRYYHRGSTPSACDGVVCAGSVKFSQPEGKSFFSNTGPRLNVFAPGEAIQSAIPDGSTEAVTAGTSDYPLNVDSSTFKITKLSGTSMASPQVSGIIASLVGVRPQYNQTHIIDWIAANSSTGRLTNSGGGFTDTASLQSAPNLHMHQPFSRSTVFSITKS